MWKATKRVRSCQVCVAFSNINIITGSECKFHGKIILQTTTNHGKEHKMFSKKIILISIVGTVLFTCLGQALGGTLVIRSSTSRGYRVARPIMPRVYNHPIHKKHAFIHPHHRTFVKRRPHPHKVVVVRRPWRRQIAVNLVPTVTVRTREIAVEHTTVTVWITNSNGSQMSVSLQKSGPGFVGPRGEYYPNMPTEEQLRMVYGF